MYILIIYEIFLMISKHRKKETDSQRKIENIFITLSQVSRWGTDVSFPYSSHLTHYVIYHSGLQPLRDVMERMETEIQNIYILRLTPLYYN